MFLKGTGTSFKIFATGIASQNIEFRLRVKYYISCLGRISRRPWALLPPGLPANR
jgi:hypothetical protein